MTVDSQSSRRAGVASVIRTRRPLVARLAAKMEPVARRAFLRAVDSVKRQVDLDALEIALRTGEISRVEAALLLDRLPEVLRAQLRPVVGATLNLGAEAGREALRGTPAFAVDFARTNPAAVAWANQRAGALVTEVTESTRLGVRALVTTSQTEGRSVDWLARELREVVGLHSRQVTAVENFRLRLFAQGLDDAQIERRTARYAEAQLKARAQMVARTETIASSNEGQHRLWEAAADQGLLDREETRRVWIVTDDDRLEENCEALDEAEAELDGPFPGGVMNPPLHPNCFVPDTQVVGAFRAVAGLEAVYSGPVVTLETRRGCRLTVTTNHPVLTPRGWVPAGCLHKGDDVLSERVRYHGRLGRWAPDNQNSPTTIEEVVDALRADGFRYAEICRDDLHGDALWSERQIEIVGAYSELRRGRDAKAVQRDAERIFVPAYVRQSFGAGASLRSQLFQRSNTSTRRGPRATALTFDGGAVALESHPLQSLRFVLTPRAHSSSKKSSAYGASADATLTRNRFLGCSGRIALEHGRLVNVASPRTSVSGNRSDQFPFTQAAVHYAEAGAQLARDLLVREAACIQRDQVVTVNRSAWHGHVYDLQTKDGFIIAEGIVASNCRCSTGLVFGEREA